MKETDASAMKPKQNLNHQNDLYVFQPVSPSLVY